VSELRTTLLGLALSAGVLHGGCGGEQPIFETGTDGDTDGDTDADADADADGDTDADTDADGDTEVDCEGFGWLDPATNTCWQDPPHSNYLNFDNAVTYCSSLQHGGYGDWRLPTISELRSLIRGCPATVTGGNCAVTDGCLGSECWTTICNGCAEAEGPGAEGCYWDEGLTGGCGWTWSSSTREGDPTNAWLVVFSQGRVGFIAKTMTEWVRCVRGGT
jgi:hypothetical protein